MREPRNTATAEQESTVCWRVEPFHRELKQLIGVHTYQCWLTRSQRNHFALAVRPWTRLNQAAYHTQ